MRARARRSRRLSNRQVRLKFRSRPDTDDVPAPHEHRLKQRSGEMIARLIITLTPGSSSIQQIALEVLQHFGAAVGVRFLEPRQLHPKCRPLRLIVALREFAQHEYIREPAQLRFDGLAVAVGRFGVRMLIGVKNAPPSVLGKT
jgi:hypothetical protein